MDKPRKLSFDAACRHYVHRFTMDHIPQWAINTTINGKYYAPQYASDRQWYDSTLFYGESEFATKDSCYASNPSWPLGQWLDSPYRRKALEAR